MEGSLKGYFAEKFGDKRVASLIRECLDMLYELQKDGDRWDARSAAYAAYFGNRLGEDFITHDRWHCADQVMHLTYCLLAIECRIEGKEYIE